MATAGCGGVDEPLRVDLLGPMRLLVDGEEVEVPGPKRRAVLALLVRADGRAVPVDDLLDQLWPGDQPDAARASLQSHVSRLRGHLGPHAASLERVGDGYRLDLGPAGSDLARARAALATAGGLSASEAIEPLAAARRLWRGEPLDEFADVPALAAWRVSLAELRGRLAAAHTDAVLEAGPIHEAVELAAALVASDPLSERAVRTLMRALHRAGRSADALRAGYDHRARLRADTGLDPSPDLGALEAEIATSAPRLQERVVRPSSRLWGRDAELAALRGLVATERLVTVLGTGGVGKTRLAMELAADADTVTALRVGPLGDGEEVVAELAEALGLHVMQGDPLTACASLLAAGPHLLLLDACEHIAADVRSIVGRLLESCPTLTVLATSREPLGLVEERRLRLAPLEVSRPQSQADLSSSPAVALLIDRARRLRPDLAVGERELDALAEVARRLDGLPLALELAAGRLSSLGATELLDRVDHALDLLGEGRHDTLRQTIAWSYDLLPADEQLLLRHLSAFPGGVDLATAEALAASLEVGAAAGAALAHLVDASMLEVELGEGTRYRQLETVRAFAREQLDAAGEGETAAVSLRRWAQALAAELDQAQGVDAERRADALLRRERTNLRAAWSQLRSDPDPGPAAAFVLPLGDLAGWRDLTEVWEWALELADDPSLVGTSGETAVLGAAAGSAWARGELDRACMLAERGLSVGGGEAWRCTAALAMVALGRGELDDAIALGSAAGAAADRAEQSHGVAALAAAYRGDLDLARSLAARSAAGASATVGAFTSYVRGEIEALGGDADAAVEHYEEAIAGARLVGATLVEGLAAVGVHSARARAGQVDQALEGYAELIEYWHRTGSWVQQWTTLRNLASLLSSIGDAETALFLTGAASAAPDAPADPDRDVELARGHAPEWVAAVRRRGAVATRAQVLDAARAAVVSHRGASRSAV